MRNERGMRSSQTRRIDAALAELRRLAVARKRETADGRGRGGPGPDFPAARARAAPDVRKPRPG